MRFETVITCHGLSIGEEGVTLRDATPIFRPDTPAIVMYARTSPLVSGLLSEFTASIYRVRSGGYERVWRDTIDIPRGENRWLPQQLLAIYHADYGLEPGSYLGTITLPTGDEASTSFLVG